MNGSPELDAARAAVNQARQDASASLDAVSSGADGDEPFVVLEGTPAARSEVQAARVEAEEARRVLGTEIGGLKDGARRTFDLRAQLKAMPERIQRDPARAAKVAGGVAVAVAGITVLRRLRRAKPPTLLPPEVEAAVGSLGKDAPAVRAALERSFTKYLEEHGGRGPVARIPRGAYVLVLPIVSAIAREGVRQYVQRFQAREEEHEAAEPTRRR